MTFFLWYIFKFTIDFSCSVSHEGELVFSLIRFLGRSNLFIIIYIRDINILLRFTVDNYFNILGLSFV